MLFRTRWALSLAARAADAARDHAPDGGAQGRGRRSRAAAAPPARKPRRGRRCLPASRKSSSRRSPATGDSSTARASSRPRNCTTPTSRRASTAGRAAPGWRRSPTATARRTGPRPPRCPTLDAVTAPGPVDGADISRSCRPRRSPRRTTREWGSALAARLYQEGAVELLAAKALKLTSNPGESEGDFRARLALGAARASATARWRSCATKHAAKLKSLEDRLRRASDRVEREQSQYSQRKLDTAISIGTSVLGAIFGGRSTATTRAGSAARSAGPRVQRARRRRARRREPRGAHRGARRAARSASSRRRQRSRRASTRRASRSRRSASRRASPTSRSAASPSPGSPGARAPTASRARPRRCELASRLPADPARLRAGRAGRGPARLRARGWRRRSAPTAPSCQVEGGDLPFGLELAREDGTLVAYLINGPERVRATEVRLDGDTLAIQMPGYQQRIEATWRDGRFEGTLQLLRPRGVIRDLRFVAMPGQDWRFFPKPDAAPMDFSGRWALTFRDDDGGESPGDRGAHAAGPRGHRHRAAPERRRPLHRGRGARRHAVPLALRRRHRLPLPREAAQRRRADRRPVHRRRLARNLQRPARPGGEARRSRPSRAALKPGATASSSVSRTWTASCTPFPASATPARSC